VIETIAIWSYPNDLTDNATAHREAAAELAQRHFQWGWWSLLFFVALGIVLETLHAFKVSAYLNVGNETRRLMWTLAHAHGTLLALVHVAFGATVAINNGPPLRRRYWSSRCLTSSALLVPFGFLMGGLDTHGGDPGLGILLVPAGAVLLFAAVAMLASSLRRWP
jgi:hypothetical protein